MPGGVCDPEGFRAAGVASGIKESGERDLCVIASRDRCAAAATFTRNAFRAAPLLVTIEHLRKDGYLQAVVANSGTANSWTGEQGMEDARAMAVIAARELDIHPWDVAVASTGSIGSYLPMDRVEKGVIEAVSSLDVGGGLEAARAIMTTDTHPKTFCMDFRGFKVGGMAKGSGMIHPDMATMLAFLTTDAVVDPPELDGLLHEVVDATFNRITVDGCTSTNDMVLALASGASGMEPAKEELAQALYRACSELAHDIVADGEGATRFIRVRLHEAVEEGEARRAAKAIAVSPLFKAAVFGGDPNWGRVVQALGAAFGELDEERVRVKIGGLTVAGGGEPAEVERERLCAAMEGGEVVVDVYLGRGGADSEVWTCDLSQDYVRINAEYHT